MQFLVCPRNYLSMEEIFVRNLILILETVPMVLSDFILKTSPNRFRF